MPVAGIGLLDNDERLTEPHRPLILSQAVGALEVMRTLHSGGGVHAAREEDQKGVRSVHEKLELVDGMKVVDVQEAANARAEGGQSKLDILGLVLASSMALTHARDAHICASVQRNEEGWTVGGGSPVGGSVEGPVLSHGI